MQLRQQYKHLWFVFLMIFFIGGNSVAVAAVQSIQPEQVASSMRTMHCHEQHMMDQSHHLSVSHADANNVEKCHEGKALNEQHCQDCNSSSHCQIVNLALDQQLPELTSLPFLELDHHKNIAYQAQHLAGYWQEILRPPKA